jgi:response regulator RpfG family c-di-GMP phosphodiesterase
MATRLLRIHRTGHSTLKTRLGAVDEAGMSAVAEPRPRILCVDDEPLVLEGLRDTLRRSFEVRVAEGGAEGLALLRADVQGYAIVLSDMRMPGMSGSVFLREARRVAPLAVRMLLTGHSDMDSAAKAVNDGQIFRFLTKPCHPEELMRACAAAVWQHRLAVTERVLLEETLHGSIRALTDVMALASPAAFGRGVRVKQRLARFLPAIGMEDGWELEVAAMLSHLGAITLPDAAAEKLYAAVPLAPHEAEMVDRVPAVTERILANIPRLEGVRQILANYRRSFDSIASDGLLPVGARVLRILLDYDELETQSVPDSVALDAMRSREGVYDPDLLEAFAGVVGVGRQEARVREVGVREVSVGMTLAADVRSRAGHLLIARGYPVTRELVDRLRNFQDGHVREPVRVFDPEPMP